MNKSNWSYSTIILFFFIVLNVACAQVAPYTGQAYISEKKLVEASTVLFNNDKNIIPLQNLEQLKVASIHFSGKYFAGFDSLLNKYDKVKSFSGADYTGPNRLAKLADDLKLYNTLIVQLNDNEINNTEINGFIKTIGNVKNLVVVVYGNALKVKQISQIGSPVIWAQRVSPVSAYFAAQAIFGGVGITHKLNTPDSPPSFITTKNRLEFTVPEDAGINTTNLLAIDAIANEAVAEHATPGCVVLVAKDGKVIYNKAFGYHTYSKTLPDKLTDLFDIASMTKISATTMEAMLLFDQGKLNLSATAGDYLALARNTNKNDITVREILEHQAGLIPDIPTFEKVKPTDHNVDSSAVYPTKVNDNYYLRKDYFKEVMWPDMLNSPLKTRGQYVYSDLSMCFMQQIEETLTATPLNEYVQRQFYMPLGMQSAGFLPLYRFKPDQIIPTENEQEYRHELLDGYVHDPTAALMGGVAGHAGLFASANDLAILYQMMLNRGSYGGVQYVKPETVDLFTSKQSNVSRRGLGFDRWDPLEDHHYPSKLASPEAYGHTGFTGTCVWVDPKYHLVYIFLSNRVNPNVGSKLSSLNIRPRIQDAIYEAINKGL